MATNGISLVLDNKELGGVIPLHSASRGLLSYNPSRASRGAETVTETIRLWFDSGLQAATQGTGILRKIGTYFVDARRRAQLGQGDQIWLILDKGIGDGDWRSEVLDGEIVYPEETLGPAFLQSDKGEVAIIITRRAYWEKDTEYEIPLSIGALAAIGGKAIENHHDGDAGDVNWVSWDVPAIIGDLPTPLKVEFKNTDATHDYRRILMALTYDTDDVGDMSTNWSLEGEDQGYNPGTITANANSSDGNYMVEAWTAVTETLVATWTLDPTELARGNPFRAVARMWSAYDNLYARMTIVAPTATGDGEVWRGKLVKCPYVTASAVAEELVDLGTVHIPPHMPDGLEASSVRVFLYFLRNAAGTHTVNIDHLTFMPMDGGFRKVESSSYQNAMQQNDTLVDDGITGRTYVKTSTPLYVTMFTTQGEYLHALPHKPGRLTFLWMTSAYLARANMTATVKVFYRPRRATL
jgi:hypothetical protein